MVVPTRPRPYLIISQTCLPLGTPEAFFNPVLSLEHTGELRYLCGQGGIGQQIVVLARAIALSLPEHYQQLRHVRHPAFRAGLHQRPRHLHDRQRQGLQKFIGQADWEHQPLLTELARQVGSELGQDDGVLVFDPSAFPKQGTESVGVQRQWCGRLGKIDNCQVGIYLGYVSRSEHALVDVRLYLPKQWARRKRRRQKAGVPAEVRFRTRHELALQMLDERGPLLPHAWISGDDE